MRVALIDDDEPVLDALKLFLERKGLSVACYGTADAFLAAGREPFDCIVADVRMPGTSGLDLVGRMAKSSIPVVLITGHGDIEMAVSAIKLGAFDFIEKPFDESRLLAIIENAAAGREAPQSGSDGATALMAKAGSLTERQRQVMELAALGLSNKEIGKRLGISSRTVEVHRAWMMEKMGARNLAELVRMDVLIRGSR
jgi:two-component system response regulator FixJ